MILNLRLIIHLRRGSCRCPEPLVLHEQFIWGRACLDDAAESRLVLQRTCIHLDLTAIKIRAAPSLGKCGRDLISQGMAAMSQLAVP